MSERFFNSLNKVEGITDEDYSRVPYYIQAVESIARVSYNSVYIIDYNRRNFLYVSANPLFLCGRTPEEIKDMGYNFYTDLVPEDELKMLLKINEIGFRFFNTRLVDDRPLFSISYDFHIRYKDDYVLINHKLTPLAMAPNGHIWLAVCYVSLSNHDRPGNIKVYKLGQSDFWRYETDVDRWIKTEAVKLTDREKEVLLLAAAGMTVETIARKVHRSVNSIKTRRRAIFEKLNVRSISEAISFATNYKLI